VAVRAVSSTNSGSLTSGEGAGMSFTCKLNSLGDQVHPGQHQPACNGVWMWLTGRTFGTFGIENMRIWFSPGKTGCLG
jgi:hypothetical protein